jgi:hypothetical protein
LKGADLIFIERSADGALIDGLAARRRLLLVGARLAGTGPRRSAEGHVAQIERLTEIGQSGLAGVDPFAGLAFERGSTVRAIVEQRLGR